MDAFKQNSKMSSAYYKRSNYRSTTSGSDDSNYITGINEERDTREFWQEIMWKLEFHSFVKYNKLKIRKSDYSVALPPKLRDKYRKVMDYEYDEFDRNVFIADDSDRTEFSEDDSDDEETIAKKKEIRDELFNESTCSEIVRMGNEFPAFDIKIAVNDTQEKKKQARSSWLSRYICQSRRERVQWDSKIYRMERSIWEKSLDEQAEMMMDASAERFTEWMNSLSSHKEGHMTKERVKTLFSIEGEKMLLASMHTEPHQVNAIAQTVAQKWNLPDMAIELKYENYLRDRLMNVRKEIKTVAFGATIPVKNRPWRPALTENDKPISTIFPKELLSGERIFKGIRHLRTVKALTEFLIKHPNIEKPEYLLNSGMFTLKEKEATKHDIPLYELLKLKY